MKLLGILVFIAVCTLVCAKPKRSQSGNAAGRAELRRRLFSDYDKINIPDNVSVKFGISLIGLDADEDRGTLETDVWLRMLWRDSRLAWDNTTNGIDVLRVSPTEIWKPDVTLYNSANLKDMSSCWNSNVVLYATGEVLWVPPCHLSSYCDLSLDKHPYGPQKCSMKFGSWTFDAELLDMQLYDSEKGAQLDDFGSTDWKIVESSAQRKESHYPCCVEAYVDVTYNITFVRTDSLPASPTCEL